jgi:molecular chaperone GrpE
MTKKKTQDKKPVDASVEEEKKTEDPVEAVDIEAAIKNASRIPASDDLESQLEEAQQSAKDNWDKALRTQAEMENLLII